MHRVQAQVRDDRPSVVLSTAHEDEVSPLAVALCADTPCETEMLSASIARVIRRRTRGMIRDLDVEIGPGGVVLRGHSSTYYGKQLAQHAALAVAGGHALRNEITVT